jgi:hypothetical protein
LAPPIERSETDTIGLDHWNPLHSEVGEEVNGHKAALELLR